MDIISGIIVFAFGLGLIALAGVIAAKRLLAERFLNLFASSARTHYIEQVLRLVVGTSLVIFSPLMWYSYVFQIFGWLFVVTTLGLLLVPWQWHHRFAERVIPLGYPSPRNIWSCYICAWCFRPLWCFSIRIPIEW